MSADPYQYYVGQQGYRMKPISKADEKNIAMTHCQLSLQTPPQHDSLPDVCHPPSVHDHLLWRSITRPRRFRVSTSHHHIILT